MDKISFIEAYGNYLKIHTPEKVYVIRDTMTDMERKLPSTIFMRIHKS
ncbi:MAG: LytTR family transcriptional regulator, partial [Bacteroidales bacterium]|nr:LytTR family transcriptional regulator [Bacteroidales bacterium]